MMLLTAVPTCQSLPCRFHQPCPQSRSQMSLGSIQRITCAPHRLALQVTPTRHLARASRSSHPPTVAAQSGTVKIMVQGRQVELTDSMKAYAEEKVGRAVSHFEGAIKQVDVRLSVGGGDAGHGKKRQRTELTVFTLRNGIVRAEDVEEDMYASIDLVCDRLQRKLRKVKGKAISKGRWQGRGGPKGSKSIADPEATSEEYADDIDEDIATHEEIADAVKSTASAQEQSPPQSQHSTGATQEIMRTKNFFLKPMSAEAAVEQCDQLGHDFYIFRELLSDQVQVVYKRRSVGYGVIVPVNDEEE